MASNTFGNVFKITTWGESHGPAIGVVIDGCPAGLKLSVDDINQALALRAPGRNPHTSPRREPDLAELLSGVFEGNTTGTPISILIKNRDADSSKYEPIKNILRPGHANFTYLKKYGCFDYRGGGRASARETACRVAAGAVAQKILDHYKINIDSYMFSIHDVAIHSFTQEHLSSLIFCPDQSAEQQMIDALNKAQAEGDSLGGIVEFTINNLPVGLGDPIYEKLEAKLASGMMSLPASKGFEVGEGFAATRMKGSQHNDQFIANQQAALATNHGGGILGGISSGMPIIGRVAFKPTSSIRHEQASVTIDGRAQAFKLPEGSRHDPCVAIRAVPVVKAMCQLVIADAIVLNHSSQLSPVALQNTHE